VSDDPIGTKASAQLRRVPREARAFQGKPAGIVTRSFAVVVDAIVLVVSLFALWAAWGAALFIVHPTRFHFPSPSRPLYATVACLMAFFYFTAAWATSGRTYGAQLLGLRVVSSDRDRVHWGVSALRSALCIVFPAGLLWAAVSRENRSVQDILFRTVVIYDWMPQVAHGKPGPPEPEASSRG
jgi:uncharacterized RDD family membrane protein YckC